MIKVTNKISQGMYVLTTNNGGCVIDALSQISSGESPLIAISVMKKNHTNQLLKENEYFAISILGKDVQANVIQTFGFETSKKTNKFAKVEHELVDNLAILPQSIGYMICQKVDSIENETHTLFIGKLIKEKLIKDEPPMTYAYYQSHKEELLKVTTEKGKTAWVCSVCGYIVYQENLPDDYKCPICNVGKELFLKKES